MDMTSYADQADAIAAHLAVAPEVARVVKLLGGEIDFSADMAAAILGEAARLAEGVLAPMGRIIDRDGARMVDGRVKLAPAQRDAWRQFCDGGWMTLTVPVAQGGQGLPMVALGAVHELFERASIAFCMLPGSSRSAARLLETHGTAEMQAEWLPKLASGEWGATICISEPDAGSDLGRARTRASEGPDGWRVTGEKIWISYGDHDLTARIGHMVLARTEADSIGTRGLSLFLVPSELPDGTRNAVVTRRIEEKMGLHGSPTCALGFEGAAGTLIGERGRGLPQLFRMVIAMRLSVGVQGTALAAGAEAVARGYAAERKQGGRPDAPPVPIDTHPDVQRMLTQMRGTVEGMRGLVLAASAIADLADLEPDAAARAEAASLLSFLLPLVKTGGAEAGFAVASEVIQVLGGAGYTAEWPVEQMLRDSRVLGIYEGTTGIQAQDLVRRRLLGDGRPYALFVAKVAAEATECAPLRQALALLEQAADWLRAPERTAADIDYGATAFLRLAILVARGWGAVRATRTGDANPIGAQESRKWLRSLPAEAGMQAQLAMLGAAA